MKTWALAPLLGLAAAGYLAGASPVNAQDKLKLAVGQRGNWDTSISGRGTSIITSMKWAWDVYFSNIKLGVGRASRRH